MHRSARFALLVVLLLGVAGGCHKKGRGGYLQPVPMHVR
jgi:hypothetical protein